MGPTTHAPLEPMGRDSAVRWWWAVAPSAELAAVARGLERAEPPAGAAVIKGDARRTVWSAPGTAGGLLLKRFGVRGAERWKYVLRPSRAAGEYRAMEAFVRLGLPVVRPIGYGEQRRGALLQQAWFVGRLVPQARTLSEALDAARARGDAATARALASDALRLTAELHRHPWLHRDLHAGNLLLDAAGQLLVTDLHSVWRVPRLTRRMRLENLARLLFSMRGGLDLGLVPELLREHAARTGEDGERLVADGLDALRGFERAYVAGRVRRCVQESSLFEPSRAPEGRIFRRRSFPVEQLRADLAEHSRQLAEGGARVLGSAPRSRVTLVGEGGDARVVKEYLPGGVPAALRQALGQGRGRSAWMGARRLEVLAIPTPEALALLERRDGTAVLVTAALVGARSLRDVAAELAREPLVARRAAVAAALGRLMGRLARGGLRHADMSAKNVWILPGPPPPARDVRDAAPPGAANLWLIDLDGLRPMEAFDEAGLARMLGQLADLPARPSRTDRLRFERGYAATAGRALPAGVVERAGAKTARRVAARGAALDPAPRAP